VWPAQAGRRIAYLAFRGGARRWPPPHWTCREAAVVWFTPHVTATTQKDSSIVLRFLAAPMDITYGGTVHGGKLLEWIDKAGYACAAGWSAHYCVTVYVGDVRFTRPVAIGELVEV
jgi:hypothetical protein